MLKTEVRDVNPIIAKEMLKRNQRNRKCNEAHVTFLANQMENDKWLFDASPIRFSEDGRLLDGQHRLSAVVKSNKTQQFLIVTGVKSESFKVMDTGRNRGGSDVLYINGIKYSTVVASAARFIIKFKKGNISQAKASNKTTNSDILSWYENNKAIMDIIKNADKMRVASSNVLTSTQIASFHFLFAEKNVLDAEKFIHKLCTGLDLDLKSPIFVLRKRLIQDKLSKAKLPTKEKSALIVKAWNLYRKGKECQFLRWNKENEKFPEII
jgi:hypothetical protein